MMSYCHRKEIENEEDERFFEHERAIAGGSLGPAALLGGHGRLPAALVRGVHRIASSIAEARVSMSSSLVVSVTAITSPRAIASAPG